MRKFLRAIGHSLSARLLGIFLITAVLYVIAARFTVSLVLDRDYLREMMGSHVALHAGYLIEDLGSPPSIARAEQLVRDNAIDIRLAGPGLDWVSDPNFPPREILSFELSEFFDRLDFDDEVWRDKKDLLLGIRFARFADHSYVQLQSDGYEITIASPKLSVSPGSSLTTPLIGILSLVVLAGCFFAVSWLVRPIGWIKEGAARIGAGDLDYRIPKTRRDDLGALTGDINRMADDVKEMLEAKQQLLLAISHELRTPLTRTKVAAEFIDDEATRQSILEDVWEMEHLVDDLLESERLNTRHSKLQLGPVDLARLVSDLVVQEFDAESDQVSLRIPAAPVPHELDATRIRLLVKNLVENAICHTPPAAEAVEVEVEDTGDAAIVRVVDYGAGMSPEQVDRATEPFYRADPARCRDTGGFGLGLYLCRLIAEAHGGTLEIDSQLGRGTRVTLRLPRPAGRSAA